jgi:epoxyqueuosine reductase
MDNLSETIKKYAASIGFDACGFCPTNTVDSTTTKHLKQWLSDGYQADMNYMSNYPEIRTNPSLLTENAKSIICVALNYYPDKKQHPENPQIAYYAYGKDYHDVMKNKLYQLLDHIKKLDPSIEGRAFCDTAPILERYWAAQCGIGFVGKNSMLIIPKKGSFFFLGELIINKELKYDTPIKLSCGNCSLCIDTCPTKAIRISYTIDSNKCISYQTIENRKEIDTEIVPLLNNCVYGCDICQKVCPWNRFSVPTHTSEFSPSQDLLDLNHEKLKNLSEEEYRRIFKGSAVKRAKYTGLKRNIEALYQKK